MRKTTSSPHLPMGCGGGGGEIFKVGERWGAGRLSEGGFGPCRGPDDTGEKQVDGGRAGKGELAVLTSDKLEVIGHQKRSLSGTVWALFYLPIMRNIGSQVHRCDEAQVGCITGFADNPVVGRFPQNRVAGQPGKPRLPDNPSGGPSSTDAPIHPSVHPCRRRCQDRAAGQAVTN